MADPASGVYDRTSLPPVKTGFGKRGSGGSSVVRINEGTNPPLTTRPKFHEVGFTISQQLVPHSSTTEPAPPMPPTIPEGYFPYFLPPPGYFQGADGQNGAPPPVQVPFYPYHQLAPFPYPAGIPMSFMQPLSGQPGPSHHVEPPQPQNAKGKRQRSSTGELSTPKKAKSDDQQTDGTPEAEGNDASPPATESTPQPSDPPSTER